MIAWATTNAVWSAPDGALCRQHQDGACWAFIFAKLDYLRFGSYPISERWRVNIVEAIGACLIVWLLWPGAPRRGWAALMFFVGLSGHGVRSACTVPRRSGCRSSTRCSGAEFFVSLLTAVVGIVFSLPLGVLLALGRRSKMPVVQSWPA